MKGAYGPLATQSAPRLTSALRSICGISSETLIRCTNSNTKETRK